MFAVPAMADTIQCSCIMWSDDATKDVPVKDMVKSIKFGDQLITPQTKVWNDSWNIGKTYMQAESEKIDVTKDATETLIIIPTPGYKIATDISYIGSTRDKGNLSDKVNTDGSVNTDFAFTSYSPYRNRIALKMERDPNYKPDYSGEAIEEIETAVKEKIYVGGINGKFMGSDRFALIDEDRNELNGYIKQLNDAKEDQIETIKKSAMIKIDRMVYFANGDVNSSWDKIEREKYNTAETALKIALTEEEEADTSNRDFYIAHHAKKKLHEIIGATVLEEDDPSWPNPYRDYSDIYSDNKVSLVFRYGGNGEPCYASIDSNRVPKVKSNNDNNERKSIYVEVISRDEMSLINGKKVAVEEIKNAVKEKICVLGINGNFWEVGGNSLIDEDKQALNGFISEIKNAENIEKVTETKTKALTKIDEIRAAGDKDVEDAWNKILASNYSKENPVKVILAEEDKAETNFAIAYKTKIVLNNLVGNTVMEEDDEAMAEYYGPNYYLDFKSDYASAKTFINIRYDNENKPCFICVSSTRVAKAKKEDSDTIFAKAVNEDELKNDLKNRLTSDIKDYNKVATIESVVTAVKNAETLIDNAELSDKPGFATAQAIRTAFQKGKEKIETTVKAELEKDNEVKPVDPNNPEKNPTHSDNDSSSGCNAGLGGLLLLTLAPVVLRKHRK